jgi:hypothetical protein
VRAGAGGAPPAAPARATALLAAEPVRGAPPPRAVAPAPPLGRWGAGGVLVWDGASHVAIVLRLSKTR